ncbi:MAG: hypothetical protein ACJ8FY_01120 [Gemmataceae bacterium]
MKPTTKPTRTAEQRAEEEALRRRHAANPVRQRPAGAINQRSFAAILKLVRMGIDPPALPRNIESPPQCFRPFVQRRERGKRGRSGLSGLLIAKPGSSPDRFPFSKQFTLSPLCAPSKDKSPDHKGCSQKQEKVNVGWDESSSVTKVRGRTRRLVPSYNDTSGN